MFYHEDDVILIKYFDNGIEKHITKYTQAYLKYRKGSRGKMALSNEDLFIFTGQQFIFSISLGILFFLVQLIKLIKKSYSFLGKIIIYIYRIIFSLLIFDYQIIAISEILLHDWTRPQPLAYKMSYLWSLYIFFIVVFELVQAYSVFNTKMSSKYKSLSIEQINKLSKKKKNRRFSYDQELYFNELTEGLSKKNKVKGNTIILDSIVHFLVL